MKWIQFFISFTAPRMVWSLHREALAATSVMTTWLTTNLATQTPLVAQQSRVKYWWPCFAFFKCHSVTQLTAADIFTTFIHHNTVVSIKNGLSPLLPPSRVWRNLKRSYQSNLPCHWKSSNSLSELTSIWLLCLTWQRLPTVCFYKLKRVICRSSSSARMDANSMQVSSCDSTLVNSFDCIPVSYISGGLDRYFDSVVLRFSRCDRCN